LIIGALIFAGAFVISLPFLFPLAMSPGDTSFATNVAVVLLFSVIPVFVGSRFLAVLPLVVRGRGLGAIGEAWRRSRHAGWPGRLGVILILLVLASTSYFSRLVGPGTLRVVVVQIGWTLVIFAGALFEEGFQEVTSAESEEASAT
jgi:hypothetical protein